MDTDFSIFDPVIQRSDIIRAAVIRNYASDETLIIEEDSSAQVYFIISGRVKVTSFHSNGKEVWHATLDAGYSFGEMAAIRGQTRSATVMTLEPSRIAVLPEAAFLKALEDEPGLALYFLKDMTARLQTATAYANERIALDVPSRICVELLRQAVKGDKTGGAGAINAELTVTALAQRINAKRETVSRNISNLTKAGLIKKDGRQFVILDWQALEQRAQGL